MVVKGGTVRDIGRGVPFGIPPRVGRPPGAEPVRVVGPARAPPVGGNLAPVAAGLPLNSPAGRNAEDGVAVLVC